MIDPDPPNSKESAPKHPPHPPASTRAVLVSTLTSLSIVLVLLLAVRWVLPPLLESSRYSWYRGQLRAEHEAAGELLHSVSLDGLSRISELVSQRVTPSVVHINVSQIFEESAWKSDKSDFSRDTFDRLKVDGQGSGVIVDREGYILTNNHVLEGGEFIDVRFSDESRCEARIVGIDEARDLAVLKVDKLELPPVEWGDSDLTSVGSPVWAIGSPFGLHGSITFGILSSKHRVDLSESPYQYSRNSLKPRYSDLMQSDVAVNPGNSGGPLVNGQGQLVGINTAILGESYRGVSFSIPSNIVKKIYEEIREKAKSPRGWMGVGLKTVLSETEDLVAAKQKSKTQVVVTEFAKFGQSPARAAGIKRGDVIVSFNGRSIEHHTELIDLIGKATVSSTVQLGIVRNGSPIGIDVVLGPRAVKLEVTNDEAGN